MYPPFSLLFSKEDSVASKLISTVTNESYTHVAMILDDFHTLESNYKTPTLIKHFDYLVDDYDVFVYDGHLNHIQKRKIIDFIFVNISRKYDFQYFFSRGFNKLIGTPIINNPKRWNCDELIYCAYRFAGVELIDGVERLTPEALSNSKYLKKIK